MDLRLKRLGVLEGRTYQQIVEMLGEPQALSQQGDGSVIAQF